MKKNIFLISVMLSYVLLVGYFYHITKNKNILLEKTKNLIQVANHSKDQIIEKLRSQITTDGSEISELTFVENSKGESVPLKSLIQDKPLLVFFVKSINCSVCLDEEMAIFSEIIQKFKINNRIIVIRSFQNKRQKIVFENQFNVPVYETKDNTLNIPAEKKQTPFYFVLTPEFLVQNTYIPDRYNSDLSKEYLEIVSKRLSN